MDVGNGAKENSEATSTSATGDARFFLKWFFRSPFRLMESFLKPLDHRPDADDVKVLKRQFRRATRHARVVNSMRAVVTLLLVVAGGSTLVTSLASYAQYFPQAQTFISKAIAIASTFTVVFLVLRLILDRHLKRVEIYATFVAMQIAGGRDRGREENGG